MEINKIIMADLNKMCRACLITKESFTYFFFDNVSIDIYWFCTSLQVIQSDEFPKALCNGCYELLIKFSEFKRICIQSQDTLVNLSNHVQTLNTQTEEIESIENENHNSIKSELSNFDVKTEDTSDHFDDDLINCEHDNIITQKNDRIHKRRKKLAKAKQYTSKSGKLVIARKHYLFTCEFCNKKFNYHDRLEAHKLQQHEGKTISIVCKQCDKTFTTWSGLKRHSDNEHTLINLEALQCSICGKTCKTRQTLQAHHKIHGRQKLSICDICGKRFTNDSILKVHLEIHKENRERDHSCEHCNKKFFTKGTLLSHVSKRHSGRRYVCQLCSYPFADKSSLALHLLRHDGKKPYKCDICDNAYSSHSTLVEHKRIHSGDRPYNCDFCPKSFLSRRRLIDHHRTHTGEKPYKCDVCEQGFAQRGTRKRHMKIHEKAMPVIN